MRLNEALLYRWAGKDIKRRGWDSSSLPFGHGPYNGLLDKTDIDADDWEVVPEYVDLYEAIKALSKNKIVAADDIMNNGKMLRKFFRLDCNHKNLLYRDNECCEWATYSFGIPLRWLHKDNFEILEEC